jgi:hypothetical protein
MARALHHRRRMRDNIAEQVLDATTDLRDARHLVDVEGMSSPKVCVLLNQLVARMDPGEHYLEIGTWKGRTLLSAAHDNPGRICFACDKFRMWGRHTGWGHRARRTLLDNVERHRGRGAEIRFFDMPARRLFERRLVPRPIGVYFYDGGHSHDDTREGLRCVGPLLAERSVIVVDDWNDPGVRRGAFAGVADAGLDVLWHRHLHGDHDETGFWNGVGVFFVQSPHWAPARLRRAWKVELDARAFG